MNTEDKIKAISVLTSALGMMAEVTIVKKEDPLDVTSPAMPIASYRTTVLNGTDRDKVTKKLVELTESLNEEGKMNESFKYPKSN